MKPAASRAVAKCLLCQSRAKRWPKHLRALFPPTLTAPSGLVLLFFPWTEPRLSQGANPESRLSPRARGDSPAQLRSTCTSRKRMAATWKPAITGKLIPAPSEGGSPRAGNFCGERASRPRTRALLCCLPTWQAPPPCAHSPRRPLCRQLTQKHPRATERRESRRRTTIKRIGPL